MINCMSLQLPWRAHQAANISCTFASAKCRATPEPFFGHSDNIGLSDGYKWVRGTPVEGCSAIWSARKEAAAKVGVRSASLESLPELEDDGADDGDFQLSTPQVPKTNAARSNYAISARNNNFGANKSTHLEYGQLKGPQNDPTQNTGRSQHFSGRRMYWKDDAQGFSARNRPIKLNHARTNNGGFFARRGAEC